MEENVALDSTKQKKFVKSIKGIKKLLKSQDPVKDVNADKTKEGKVTKRRRKERGLVYLSHIPHGFYENEMTQYFKQFGMVTNARVIRSKKTGNSKGFAFVEFRDPSVAQIVADTMNNYLMGKRLLKAAIIPPEKQRFARRKQWSTKNNPANDRRIKMKKTHNAPRDDKQELQRAKKILSTLNRTMKRLQELGIDYDFFTPVDMPEALIKTDPSKEKQQDKDKNKGQSKKDKQTKTLNDKPKDGIPKKQAEKPVKEKSKKHVIPTDKQMKHQKQKMLKKGVTPLEEFIEVNQDDESDESAFDSDEFDKMMESDDEFDSGDDDDTNDEQSDEEQSDEEQSHEEQSDEEQSHEEQSDEEVSDDQIIPVPKKFRGKEKPAPKPIVKRGPLSKKSPQNQSKVTVTQKSTAAQKKPKFEKQNKQKPRNKQFKNK